MRKELVVLMVVLGLLLSAAGGTRAAGESGSQASCPTESTLCAMLAYVPDVLAQPEIPWMRMEYGNAAAQLAAVGASVPSTLADDEVIRWYAALVEAGVPVFSSTYAADWPADHFGFRIVDIEESLRLWVNDDPTDSLMVLRVRFDRAEAIKAWSRAGYVEYQVGAARAWSIRGDREMDNSWEVNFVFDAMNYATILADGVLAFSNTAAGMADLIGAASGEIPSLADRPDLASLLERAEPEVAGAHIVPGVTAGSTAELLMLAWTPGGPILWSDSEGTPFFSPDVPHSRAWIALRYPDGTDTAAVASRIASNLATMSDKATNRPYVEHFPTSSVSAVPGQPIVVVELRSEERVTGYIAERLLIRPDAEVLV